METLPGDVISTDIRMDIASLRALFSASAPVTEPGQESEWGWGDEDGDADGDSNALRTRLVLEVEDALCVWLERLSEVACMRSLALALIPSGAAAVKPGVALSGAVETDTVSDMVRGLDMTVGSGPSAKSPATDAKKHKVVKSSSSQEIKVFVIRFIVNVHFKAMCFPNIVVFPNSDGYTLLTRVRFLILWASWPALCERCLQNARGRCSDTRLSGLLAHCRTLRTRCCRSPGPGWACSRRVLAGADPEC
jgi:hypothetical protein